MINHKKTFSYLAAITLVALATLLLVPSKASSSGYLRRVLTPKNGRVLTALFTPQDNIRHTIVQLINNESLAIQLAVYFLTDEHIANALKKANERGVATTIVTDPKHASKCPHTKIFDLAKTKTTVKVFKCKEGEYGLMHHKFMILEENFDHVPLVLTGSFNHTNSAQTSNQENIIITDDPDMVASFRKQFDFLQENSEYLDEFMKRQLQSI